MKTNKLNKNKKEKKPSEIDLDLLKKNLINNFEPLDKFINNLEIKNLKILFVKKNIVLLQKHLKSIKNSFIQITELIELFSKFLKIKNDISDKDKKTYEGKLLELKKFNIKTFNKILNINLKLLDFFPNFLEIIKSYDESINKIRTSLDDEKRINVANMLFFKENFIKKRFLDFVNFYDVFEKIDINLDKQIDSYKIEPKKDNRNFINDFINFSKGLKMLKKNFKLCFEKNNIIFYKAIEKKDFFDSEKHEIINTIKDNSLKNNLIIQTLNDLVVYKSDGKTIILRKSSVIINSI